jgi:hypothetical protein
MTPAANPFPLVLCINLRDRDDRRAEVCAELRRIGLPAVEFFRAERSADRDQGCRDSHFACLGRVLAAGVPQALILEDDVLFQGDHAANLARCAEFLRTRPECDFLHLGGFVFRRAGRPAPHFLRGGILTTHAYVVRAGWARELLRAPLDALAGRVRGLLVKHGTDEAEAIKRALAGLASDLTAVHGQELRRMRPR